MDTGLTGGTAGNASLDTAGLLSQQEATQAKAMEYQTKSTDLQTKFQMHSASEKNRAAVSTSVAALANQQSQALARA